MPFIFNKRKIFLPGDDEETVALKKRFQEFSLPGPLGLTLLGLALWFSGIRIVALGLWIFALISLMIFVVFYFVRSHVRFFATITMYFHVLFSFVAVLFFGGILHSGGVVFVGLAGAMFSLSFLKARQFRTLFFIYLLTVLIEAFLQPYLTPIPELTPTVNLILFVLHILVISMVMFSTISYFVEQRIQDKQKEADRLKEIDSLKTQFYTNITHEFRTPLTVIIGMADQIKVKPKEYLVTGLQLIRRNGTRLLHLINQMLDLSRIEAGNMTLNLIQGDIIRYLRYLSEPFERMAYEKNIHFYFNTDAEEILMDYDPEKIETLVGNLLSNAIKYSPEDSSIYLRIDHLRNVSPTEDHTVYIIRNQTSDNQERKLRLIIEDKGVGIPANQLNRIFERFVQVDDGLTRPSEGSGIGLSLVKELVNLMNGDLFLKSIHGKGTTITVCLPVTNMAPNENNEEYEMKAPLINRNSDDFKKMNEKWSLNQNLHQLLVIEDNPDVVYYIQSVMDDKYHIEVANRGEEGINKALEMIPDAILTDIMMPGKDGYEVCRVLKNDFRTSHIPIIMLTAKADTSSKITGLEQGADVYLTKPFNRQELLVRLEKLIELRERLKSKYHLMAVDPSPVNSPENPDELFIAKLKEVLSANVDDDTFDNHKLCRELGISRVQLYRKLKSLTGQSATQLIRFYRLNKARNLILSTNLNVSEVAYEVGFKDPAYFTRVFTREFGISPTAMRTNQNN